MGKTKKVLLILNLKLDKNLLTDFLSLIMFHKIKRIYSQKIHKLNIKYEYEK